MADLVLLPALEGSPDWQPMIGAVGAVVTGMDDIDQCIRTILSTPKGSLPHEPEFGSDLWRYLDWPIDEARAHIIREVVDAIGRWETRVEITAVAYGMGKDIASAVISIVRRRAGASTAGGTLRLGVDL